MTHFEYSLSTDLQSANTFLPTVLVRLVNEYYAFDVKAFDINREETWPVESHDIETMEFYGSSTNRSFLKFVRKNHRIMYPNVDDIIGTILDDCWDWNRRDGHIVNKLNKLFHSKKDDETKRKRFEHLIDLFIPSSINYE